MRSKNPFDSILYDFLNFPAFSTRDYRQRLTKFTPEHELFRSASARFATETPTDPSVLSIKKIFCVCADGEKAKHSTERRKISCNKNKTANREGKHSWWLLCVCGRRAESWAKEARKRIKNSRFIKPADARRTSAFQLRRKQLR